MDNSIGNFRDKIKEVDRLQPRETDKIHNTVDSISDILDDIASTQRNNEVDDIVKASALTNNLMASLWSHEDTDMDLGDLLGAAGTLSDLMRGLVNSSSAVARAFGDNPDKLTESAKAALELDRLLAKMDGEELVALEVGEAPVEFPTVDVAHPLLISDAAEDCLFQQIDLTSALTFEDVVAAVAYDIHHQAKSISSEADKVAVELSGLARAARGGDRQQLLMSAKAAAAHVQAFCRKLTELANAIPCRNERERIEQDRLLRTAQGLRDYATQLKILAAVKAATIEDSRDTDATLTILTKNLGSLLSQGLSAMDITQKTILNRK